MGPQIAIDARRLVGCVLTGVTASWHVFDDERGNLPVGLWLTFSGLGTVEVTTPGDGSLRLFAGTEPQSFDMDALGSVVVEHLPPGIPVTSLLGERVERTIGLTEATLGHLCGLVLVFSTVAVGLANVGDEIWCQPWPDQRWSGICIEAA